MVQTRRVNLTAVSRVNGERGDQSLAAARPEKLSIKRIA